MSYPTGTTPTGGITSTGLAAFAAKSQTDWEDEIDVEFTAAFGDAESGMSDLVSGVASSVEDLADLGITATAGEINTLDGVTATTTELNYTDGVTSAIQTQLDTKSEKVAVPASASASGSVGQWAADSSYIYACTATDTWVRASAATW